MYVPSQPGLLPGQFRGSRKSVPEELPFPLNAPHKTFSYMARNLIYHLFRKLNLGSNELVLVPDYHSGAEVWAMRAAGANVRYYPIQSNLEMDVEKLKQLCTPEVRVLYVIHYLGWPQPMHELVPFCRERGITLIEDCALSLLSEVDGEPLGTFGDYAIFCLHKSLPIPHGGLLVQNTHVFDELLNLKQTQCTPFSLAGRSSELLFERLRAHSNPTGKILHGIKRGAGRVLSSVGIKRMPVGDISPDFNSVSFDVANMNIGISGFCLRIMADLDYAALRRRRRENFALMREQLAGKISILQQDLKEGMCPMFFPILVPDKKAVAKALLSRGVRAVEFWNYGYPEAKEVSCPTTRFFQNHLLELPIHQDITSEQVNYTVDQVLSLGAATQTAVLCH